MISYVDTDIFKSKANALVNPVNLEGVMGAGLAKEFKTRYPKMFDRYKTMCDPDEPMLVVGRLHWFKEKKHWIINFPTKDRFKRPSKLLYIEKGLKVFVKNYEKRNIKSVSFPMLGCGLGGLDWTDVGPLMKKYLSPLPITVYIHLYKEN